MLLGVHSRRSGAEWHGGRWRTGEWFATIGTQCNNPKHLNIFAQLRLLFIPRLALSTPEELLKHAGNGVCPKAFLWGMPVPGMEQDKDTLLFSGGPAPLKTAVAGGAGNHKQ